MAINLLQTPFPAYRGNDDFVFVCYAHANAADVYAEITQLHNHGIKIWYDEGIRPGSEWTEELASAIASCSRLLFFTTPNSVDSRHCRDEIQYALKQNKPIMVVYLEDAKLPPGLELVLGSMQAIHRSKSPPERYFQSLLEMMDHESKELGISRSGPAHRPTTPEVMLAGQARRQRRFLWAAMVTAAILSITFILNVTMQRSEDVALSPRALDPNSIALLPLQNNGGFPDQSYYPNSVSEDLLNRLVSIDGLTVISRHASFAFIPNNGMNLIETARKLGVRHLLVGGIRKDGDYVRMNIEIIDVSSGQQVVRWSDTFDHQPISSMVSIQASITRSVANEFFPQGLDVDLQARLALLSTDVPEAYEYYLEARNLIINPIEDSATVTRAASLFRLAIAADENFAWARAGLCNAYTTGYNRGDSHEPARVACEYLIGYEQDVFEVRWALGDYLRVSGETDSAIIELSAAVNLNPRSADAYIALAQSMAARFHGTQDDLDRVRANNAFMEAVSLEPGYWYGYHAFGIYLTQQIRVEEGLKQFARALSLKPTSVPTLNNIANAYFRLGDTKAAETYWRKSLAVSDDNKFAHEGIGVMYHYANNYEQAVVHLKRGTEMSPGDHIAWGRLGESMRLVNGRVEQTHSIFQKAVELVQSDLEINPGNWESYGYLGLYLGYLHEFGPAQQALNEMLKLNPGKEPMTHYWIALVKLEEGKVDAAFSALDQALADGFYRQKQFIDDEPALEALRSEYPGRMGALMDRY